MRSGIGCNKIWPFLNFEYILMGAGGMGVGSRQEQAIRAATMDGFLGGLLFGNVDEEGQLDNDDFDKVCSPPPP
jgi:hypothetical protein